MDRVVRKSLDGGIPLFLFILAVVAGLIALQYTPREEEPQIVVPMVDVLVAAPGPSAVQVERQVTIPVEKLLTQIPGVEHVYSSSSNGRAAARLDPDGRRSGGAALWGAEPEGLARLVFHDVNAPVGHATPRRTPQRGARAWCPPPNWHPWSPSRPPAGWR